MSDIHQGDGLSVDQLLQLLQERFVLLQEKPIGLTLDKARAYEEGISDAFLRAKSVENSLRFITRIPPELFWKISSYLAQEELFSAVQVCQHWRSVLTSISSLWTQIPSHNVPRMVACLEWCGPAPIKLQLTDSAQHSDVILDNILLRRNRISSLITDYKPSRVPRLRELLELSMPSVERLHLYDREPRAWGGWQHSMPEEPVIHEIWRDMPHLRELFVSNCIYVPIEEINAPNLVHLALEHPGLSQDSAFETILGMLRGCPLLETLLVDQYGNPLNNINNRTPVSLPRLRFIEVSSGVVYSGLISSLDLPPGIAIGFRTVQAEDIWTNIPVPLLTAIEHVLEKIGIRGVTVAAPPVEYGNTELLIRFDGPQGSLEITAEGQSHEEWFSPDEVFFDPRGFLLSLSHHIHTATELHLVGSPFYNDEEVYRINALMPNIVSMTLFMFDQPGSLLAPTQGIPPSYPGLERVMFMGSELGLEEIVRTRRNLGVQIQTLVLARSSKSGFLFGEYIEDFTVLRDIVDDLQVVSPTHIVEWGTENEVRNMWPMLKEPGANSPYARCRDFRFCLFKHHDATLHGPVQNAGNVWLFAM